MPDSIRMESGGPRAGPRSSGRADALAATLAVTLCPTPAFAADLKSLLDIYAKAFAALERHEIAALALTLGIVCFAVVTAIALVRTRTRASRMQAAARADIVALRDETDRANALLLAEPQIIIAWPASGDEPEILGDTSIVTPAPIPRRVLAFGTWLDPEQAQAMEHAVEVLRSRGEGFALAMATLAGRYIEAQGRAIGGRAILRIRDLSGIKRDLVELAARHQNLLRDIDTVRTLIEALPSPIWARHADGRLAFVNPAYAHAVEAKDGADAVARNLDLLDRSARDGLERAHAQGEPFAARLPVIVAGTRRVLDIFDLTTRSGSAGIGIEATEIETMRVEMARMVEAHRRTLDQLSTAVAIFAADQRLTFYNAAYATLWGLAADVLDQGPTDSAVLDRLRAGRKLPEQADFRAWKNQLHTAYRALEAQQHLWHLPDGRTLRVITTPNPQGGVTYLFDDVTERLDLERRFDALIRVQRETLDNLSEAVAVFASDGRLRLHNPAFAAMWRLAPDTLAERPHIEAVIAACRPLHGEDATWQSLRGAVTGLEHRAPMSRRIERGDGNVVDCATVPLPDGATLVTFQDVTDTVNVERALRERNDALEAADNLKSDFVHHVSYELRSPLTNIIGFTQLLNEPPTGPLTDKQREYLGYINASSAALLAIINDILDLATIDAGAMTLDLVPVDIRATMEAAAEGVRDRLAEHELALDIRAAADIGRFRADERRLRQILYNLLSNAIGFSPKGETITLAAERRSDAVRFSVTDRGPGIPPEIQDRVFDRFETHTLGSRHRGTGLGLSIVRSFVELHGGKVTLESSLGRGTTVACVFPLEHVAARAAAE
ncbi:MAG TPA: ATP-binding protein [Xanthobacteraceae bacterium]|nr:ATP-binding protein [Xanthobacteraceae bacterium]